MGGTVRAPTWTAPAYGSAPSSLSLVSTHWARNALCTLAVTLSVASALPLFHRTAPAGASVRPAAAAADGVAPLALLSQSPWVTPQQPWFNLSVGVGDASVPPGQLQVNLTFYSRIADESQFAQSAGGVPQNGVLTRASDIPVTVGTSGRTASACVTVVRDSSETPPSGGIGVCPPGDHTTLVLDCTPGRGTCGDVYPVSVALVRQGSTSTVARFTTFLTYQETGPGTIGEGGPLRVGVVLPVTSSADLTAVASASSDHRDVATTLAVNPLTVEQILLDGPEGRRPHLGHARLSRPGPDRRTAVRTDRRRRPGRGRHRRRNPEPGGSRRCPPSPGGPQGVGRFMDRHRLDLQ